MKTKNPFANKYVYELNKEDGIILDVLRDIILKEHHEIQEVYKYNCPYYLLNGPLCYLNFEKKTNTVALGFIKGFNIDDKYGLLSSDRKQIRKLYFKKTESISLAILKYYLKQAIKLNEIKKKKH